MKILFLLTRSLEATGEVLRCELAKEHAIEVIDLRNENNHGRVVDQIFSADRVISW